MEYNRRVDGYNVTDTVAENTSKNERIKDLEITYYSNGEKYADSLKYKGVTEEKIERIKKKLFDYTMYNLNCKNMSSVIPFFTIISEVERIVYEKE